MMNHVLTENVFSKTVKRMIAVSVDPSLSPTFPSMDIIYDISLYRSASPRRASVFCTITIFSILLAIFSLWFPFSNRDGGSGSAAVIPLPFPVSLILSARFTSGIRSSKQINYATPLELIGELVILGGNFRRKFTASFSNSPRIETCRTMARMGPSSPG